MPWPAILSAFWSLHVFSLKELEDLLPFIDVGCVFVVFFDAHTIVTHAEEPFAVS